MVVMATERLKKGGMMAVFTVAVGVWCASHCDSHRQPLRASSHIEILDLEGEDRYVDVDRARDGREGIQIDTWIGG